MELFNVCANILVESNLEYSQQPGQMDEQEIEILLCSVEYLQCILQMLMTSGPFQHICHSYTIY